MRVNNKARDRPISMSMALSTISSLLQYPIIIMWSWACKQSTSSVSMTKDFHNNFFIPLGKTSLLQVIEKSLLLCTIHIMISKGDTFIDKLMNQQLLLKKSSEFTWISITMLCPRNEKATIPSALRIVKI